MVKKGVTTYFLAQKSGLFRPGAATIFANSPLKTAAKPKLGLRKEGQKKLGQGGGQSSGGLAATGGGIFVPKAMHLAQNTFFKIDSLTVADSPFFTFATFFRTTEEAMFDLSNLQLIDFYPAGDEDVVGFSNDGVGNGFINALFDDNPDNGQSFVYNALSSLPVFNSLYHSFVFSFDVDHDDNAKLGAVYLDRNLIGTPNSPTKPAFSFKFSSASVGIPDTTEDVNPTPAVDFGGYYMAFPGVKIVQDDNTILTADLNNLVTTDNKPVDPAVAIAAYGTPAIYSTCDVNDLTNHGNGGPFVVTGTPIDTDAP